MNTDSIILGGGCFWCTEAAFKMIPGVISVIPGYAGGSVPNPDYETVSSGTSGHAEVVKIEYDSEKTSLEDILDVFFTTHDPTTKDRQGNDVGHQYRSIILYTTEEQKKTAESYIASIKSTYSSPIVTEVQPCTKFFEAEDYHKNYYENNKEKPYCQLVITPKLEKLKRHLDEKNR